MHAAGGRPAQGGAPHPPRRHRGPPPPARPRADHGDAGRRPAPRGRRRAAVRRPQAAARPGVPERMSDEDGVPGAAPLGAPGDRGGADLRRRGRARRRGLGVALEPARPRWSSSTSSTTPTTRSLRRVFTGTGLYALVSAVASALVALAAALLTRRHELLTLACGRRGLARRGLHDARGRGGARPGRPGEARGHRRRRHPRLGSARGATARRPTWCGRWSRCSCCPLVFFAWPGRRSGRAASVATRRPNPPKRTCRSRRRDRLPRQRAARRRHHGEHHHVRSAAACRHARVPRLRRR